MPDEYIHLRIGDDAEFFRVPSKEITYVAVGAVGPDFSPESQSEPSLPEAEPEETEIRRYILAVFDVPGFSALLERTSLQEIGMVYKRLIDESVTKESISSFNYARRKW